MKTHLIFGAIGGLVLCTFHFVRYLIDPMWVLGEYDNTFLLIELGFLILISFLSIRTWKKQTGLKPGYGTALKYVYVCMITASCINNIYQVFFSQYKGPDLALKNEVKIKAMLKMQGYNSGYLEGRKMGGASEEELNLIREEMEFDDSNQAKMEEQWKDYLDDTLDVQKLVMGILIPLILLIPLSMLIALFVRSRKSQKPPELYPSETTI